MTDKEMERLIKLKNEESVCNNVLNSWDDNNLYFFNDNKMCVGVCTPFNSRQFHMVIDKTHRNKGYAKKFLEREMKLYEGNSIRCAVDRCSSPKCGQTMEKILLELGFKRIADNGYIMKFRWIK